MTGFASVLVANRGEIACRILRTAAALGYRTVAVYSDADADAPHVALADRAVRLGPAPAAESYLHIDRLIAAAVSGGAGAVHPGYGFLSENADFARACAAAGLVFVGPAPEVIDAMGDKAQAKRRMRAAGVPCVPGYDGPDQSDDALLAAASSVGWPLMVKAAAGGGGRGMRRVESADALPEALARARSEARQAFGCADLILERALDGARHVEVQIFADAHGQIVHLGERDCSVQRRHQKVLEEAPSPAVDGALRARMGEAAVTAARSVGYVGAGTVEFLLDAGGRFYFLEMNTRLQVEHPVTEMLTGLDLVALQLKVAQGEPLDLTQDDVAWHGHAIEARLYAEDPAQGFLPQSGHIDLWRAPQGAGVRVDAGIGTGSDVPPHYDPLLAKIVAHGDDREMARQRLLRALNDTVVFGPTTNRRFLIDCVAHEAFARGETTTAFVGGALDPAAPAAAPADRAVAVGVAIDRECACREALAQALPVARALVNFSSAGALWHERRWRIGGWMVATRSAGLGPGSWRVQTDSAACVVEIDGLDDDPARVRVDGREAAVAYLRRGEGDMIVQMDGHAVALRDAAATAATRADDARADAVHAPMHAQVIDVRVAAGDVVKKGGALLVLEAMKMQHTLCAPRAARVANVAVAAGAQVAPDDVLIAFDPDTAFDPTVQENP